VDHSANSLALPRSTGSNAFGDTTNHVSPCAVLGNATCDTAFRGPGHGPKVGNGYLTFAATGALAACVHIAYGTLQVR
jgi:hypothetical protein